MSRAYRSADQARSADHAAVIFGDKVDRLQAASDDGQQTMAVHDKLQLQRCGDQLVSRVGDNAGIETTPLPYGLHPFTGKAPDGSSWGPLRLDNAPADFAAWPWQWSLDWVSRSLEAVLQAKSLPPPDTKPYEDERRWALPAQLTAAVIGVHLTGALS